VDYAESLGFNTSWALEDILWLIMVKQKNSQYFMAEMASVVIDNGKSFELLDVTSLFTNAAVDEALDVICSQLEKDKDLKDRMNLQIDDIM